MNKRGFTLIELLAVIVILAIIALIAIPQVTNTVSNSKNRTQEISAENYVRALKKSIAAYNLEKKFEPEVCEYEDGITTCDDIEINVEFSGNLESATVVFSDNEVVYYIVYFNENEYVQSGATPDECFVSLIPGQINEYICSNKIVALSNNLSLEPKKIKSITYNEQKCTSSFIGLDNKCSELEEKVSNIDLENFDLITFGEEVKDFDSMQLSMSYIGWVDAINGTDQENEFTDEEYQKFYENVAAFVLVNGCDLSFEETEEKNKVLIDTIGPSVFALKKLEVVSLNNNIKSLLGGSFAFNKIVSLNLGKKVEEIGNLSFLSNKLKKVTTPDSIKFIGYFSFTGVSASDNAGISTDDSIFNNYYTEEELKNVGNKIKKIKLGKNLRYISLFAFAGNMIEELTIPSKVYVLDLGSFGLNKIKKLTIEDGVEAISISAFSQNQIERLELPSSIKDIGMGAFLNNKISYLVIPESLEKIGDKVFDNNCLTEQNIINNSSLSFENLKINLQNQNACRGDN